MVAPKQGVVYGASVFVTTQVVIITTKSDTYCPDVVSCVSNRPVDGQCPAKLLAVWLLLVVWVQPHAVYSRPHRVLRNCCVSARFQVVVGRPLRIQVCDAVGCVSPFCGGIHPIDYPDASCRVCCVPPRCLRIYGVFCYNIYQTTSASGA